MLQLAHRASNRLINRLDVATRPARVRGNVTLLLLGNMSWWDRLASRIYFEAGAGQWAGFGDDEGHLSSYVAALEACREPRDVLDVGCGTGGSARAAARRWPHARVVAVDSSYRMVRYARRGAALPNLAFRRASVTQLPFPDASFDLVTGLNAPMSPLEVRRVLRPAGQVAFGYTFAPALVAGQANGFFFDRVGLRVVARGDATKGTWSVHELAPVDSG